MKLTGRGHQFVKDLALPSVELHTSANAPRPCNLCGALGVITFFDGTMPNPLELPRTAADLAALVSAQVPESIHLDYKQTAALSHAHGRDELGKDVSAFMNSDGGMLVYGIAETGHIPTAVDPGIENSTFSRERLESLILSQIAPRPSGLGIVQIPLSATHSGYAVGIPKGLMPYQDTKSHRYYKRFNFQSVPMEHFEIEDVRSRRTTLDRLVHVDIDIRSGNLVYVVVANQGSDPALDVTFEFTPEVHWRGGSPPPIIARGTKSLPAGRVLHFYYDQYTDIVNPANYKPTAFNVVVRYRHPRVLDPIQDSFSLDIRDYEKSSVVPTDLGSLGESVKDSLRSIDSTIKKQNDILARLSQIAVPTGLALSVSTLDNLAALNRGESTFLPAYGANDTVASLVEVLRVDIDLALRLNHFLRSGEPEHLSDIPGMTPALIQRVQHYFPVSDDA